MKRTRRVLLGLIGVLLVPAPGRTAGADNSACLACHGQEGGDAPFVSERTLAASIHGTQACVACHARATEIPHPPRLGPPACDTCHAAATATYRTSVHGQARALGHVRAAFCPDCHGGHGIQRVSSPDSRVWRPKVPDTCGRCHVTERKAYATSIHAKASAAGKREAPVCTDCHGEHSILAIKDPGSTASRGEVTRTCSQCHESTRIISKFGLPGHRLASFQSSYHGLASRLGDMRAANCASCHRWHDVLPASDPRSSIHPGNLTRTCGKCHAGASGLIPPGGIHDGAPAKTHWIVRLVRGLYLLLIPLTIVGLAFYNAVDWLRKALATAPGRDAGSHDEVLTRFERGQHALLFTTFAVLAYSGFALKFPEGWWATPFIHFGGEAARKLVHRWTALVFVLGGLVHLGYMLGTRRGRTLLREYVPRPSDLSDAAGLLLFNLGWRRVRPGLPHPSHIQKIEYWGLIWGSGVMAVTGTVLAFNDLALHWLPGWGPELATAVHWFEAILATATILIWHGYWVVLDPDVYPMNWAWLTGRKRVPPGSGGTKGRS